MAFLPVLSGPGRRVVERRIRLYVTAYGGRRRVSFALSRPLIDDLGWHCGERVVIAIGTGADLGAFQLSRVTRAGAGVKLTAFSRSHGLRCAVTFAPGLHGLDPAQLLDPYAAPVDLAFEIEAGALRCSLPPRAEAANVRPLARGASL